jgi:CRISPR-associated protein Cmr1
MRKAPEAAPAPAQRTSRGLVHERRTYQFITPVFGGGVRVEGHHKHRDERTPVRVPSIRGQLRFWWRACNPRAVTTVSELWESEAEVFGSSKRPSALVVAVARQPHAPRDLSILQERHGTSDSPGLGYGAFPLRGTPGQKHGVVYQYSDDWELEFFYPESIRRDVEAALWAWAHFGGLGGRTRRGFGAIAQVNGPIPSIEEGWSGYVTGKRVPWPHLQLDRTAHVVVHKSRTWRDGMGAQKFLLERLYRLRQGELGRKPVEAGNTGRPGRSFWPEPDAIRRLLQTSSREHSAPITRVDAFPRARFGMPIIFHFKDDRQGDPENTTLVPAEGNRLASPLVLRPHRTRGNVVEAMAVVLGHAAPKAVKLTWTGGQKVVQTTLTLEIARVIRPLKTDKRTFVDPIERYLEEIR